MKENELDGVRCAGCLTGNPYLCKSFPGKVSSSADKKKKNQNNDKPVKTDTFSQK